MRFRRKALRHDPRLDQAVCEWLNLQPYGVTGRELCEAFSCPREGMRLTLKSLERSGRIIQSDEGYMLSFGAVASARVD